jgi:hypothetical protein
LLIHRDSQSKKHRVSQSISGKVYRHSFPIEALK